MTVTSSERRLNALPPPPALEVNRALGINSVSIEWLAGDGSDRCYYRLSSPQLPNSMVLMQLSGADAEALRLNGYDWVTVGSILSANRVVIPRLLATLPEYAALIIEDYGDIMLESKVLEFCKKDQMNDVIKLYHQSVDLIIHMLKVPRSDGAVWCRRSFDHERFVWELNFFNKNFLEPVTRIHLTDQETAQFQKECEALAKMLSDQSQFFVHRDFHSRNIMYKDGKLAIIDFQDARLGPPSYDLVSLIFDSYVPFTQEQRLQLMADATQKMRSELGDKVGDMIDASWQPMLLQRQLKAIGSFGFLTLVKNRGDYLKYVNPALATLSGGLVKDKRWPLLSNDLIQRMQEQLATNGR